MSQPLFSIIIANYNHGEFLGEAIRSVVRQTCQDFELIIVDGGSTDNSVHVIRNFQDRIAWWCSERDNGQSDAFNKGFAKAKGTYGCWLNADDIMMPDALWHIREYIMKYPHTQWIAGSTVFFDPLMNVLWCSRCIRTSPALFRRFSAICVNGPSSFFSLNIFRDVDGFDESLHYVMDIDLWRRFLKKGIRLAHVKKYLWGFRVHSQSKTSHVFLAGNANPKFQQERLAMKKKHRYSDLMMKWDIYCTKLIRLISLTYFWSYLDTKRYKGKPVSRLAEQK